MVVRGREWAESPSPPPVARHTPTMSGDFPSSMPSGSSAMADVTSLALGD